MSPLATLSPADIHRVRTSFDLMWPRSTEMADQFYARLFEIAPDSRTLFRSDMTRMKDKFIQTLAVLVGSLDNLTGLYAVAGKLASITSATASAPITTRRSAKRCSGVSAGSSPGSGTTTSSNRGARSMR
nr:globin domain-containing protein [Rhodopseudomonas palustris]